MQTLIENVNIINPLEEIETHKNILIKDNKIKKISSKKISTRTDVNVIDGEDNYLLPGFIDCHCHILPRAFTRKRTWQTRWEFIFTMQCLMQPKQSMRVLQQLEIVDLPI